MSDLGIGIMISRLGEGDLTAQSITNASGKTISNLHIADRNGIDTLVVNFTDGTTLYMFDNGQCCCEVRYMHTGDNLEDFIGAKFVNAWVSDGPDLPVEHETHEQQFLIVTTSIGVFTVVNYNEHNGYYGGFALVARGG